MGSAVVARPEVRKDFRYRLRGRRPWKSSYC